jgi:hypothetical protein
MVKAGISFLRIILRVSCPGPMQNQIKKFAALFSLPILTFTPLHAADLPDPDGKPADMTKPVKVFLIMGQSNAVGLGKITGDKEGALDNAVKTQKMYPFLVDDAGNWTERKDVRNVRVMSGKGGGMQLFNNEWMTVKGKTMGVEYGVGHQLGNALSEPVMILKSCIGNRSLGWDLMPPGSKRSLAEVKQKDGSMKKMVVAGYKDAPDLWEADPAKGVDTPAPPFVDKNGKPIAWYAGKQWDDDVPFAQKVLSELDTYYPGAKGYEVAGFFWWQGEKDAGSDVHAANYEKNLVQFIKAVRSEFKAPNAKFVIATLGEATKGQTNNTGKIFDAMMAVDGKSGKYPEFKGNVATVYTHDMARGGSGNGHYGGDSRVYMDVGLALGEEMVKLLKGK